MKKLLFLLIMAAQGLAAQTIQDLFKHSDTEINWMGIDFSHVKLIGSFNEISDAGSKSTLQIRNEFFPEWNRLVLNEPNRYDLKGMLRKENLTIDLSETTKANAATHLEEMESYNTPNYSAEDIRKFVNMYDTKGKNGLGVLFIAETLNKSKVEAYFHFVVIDLKTKEVLLTDRIRSEPMGFGLRNYWGGAIYKAIKEIRDNRYMVLKKQYSPGN